MSRFTSCSFSSVRLHLPMHLKFRKRSKPTAVHKMCVCFGGKLKMWIICPTSVCGQQERKIHIHFWNTVHVFGLPFKKWCILHCKLQPYGKKKQGQALQMLPLFMEWHCFIQPQFSNSWFLHRKGWKKRVPRAGQPHWGSGCFSLPASLLDVIAKPSFCNTTDCWTWMCFV